MVYWIVWLIVSLLFFAIYSIKVLPGLFRSAAGSAYRVMDRGLGEFNFTDGASVLYAPDSVTSKYIKRYQIYRRAGDRYVPVFLGEWGQVPKSIEYEISAFDKHGLLLVKKRIRKVPSNARYTDAVFLPFETAYISLHVRRVDGEDVLRSRKPTRVFPIRLALFAFAAAFALVGYIYVIISFLSRALGGFVAEGLSLTPALWCRLLLLPALLLVAGTILAGCFFVYREDIATWPAPFIRKIRARFGDLAGKMASVKGRFALRARAMIGRIRCAIYNVCSLLVQSNVFYISRMAITRLLRPFRVRKGRRTDNG